MRARIVRFGHSVASNLAASILAAIILVGFGGLVGYLLGTSDNDSDRRKVYAEITSVKSVDGESGLARHVTVAGEGSQGVPGIELRLAIQASQAGWYLDEAPLAIADNEWRANEILGSEDEQTPAEFTLVVLMGSTDAFNN